MIEWLTNNPATVTTVGLFGSFTIILLWVCLPTRKDLQEQAMIPFRERDND
jgi:hypothetical protein